MTVGLLPGWLSIIAAMFDDQSVWPREIYATDQVRGFDRHAIDELGIPGFDLMQRAGRDALAFLRARWPEAQSLLIYCGAGNNAGDGYVVAALASAAGMTVQIVAVVDPEALGGDAAAARDMARQAGVPVLGFETDAEQREAASGLPAADVVVDALLGTGLKREVGGPVAAAVAAINQSVSPVLALDIPTGLDGDSGAVHGVAVAADATITFVGLKSGLYLGRGPELRGVLGFSDLDLPQSAYSGAAPALKRIDSDDCKNLLKPRSRTAHKGLNGRVLVVGGSRGMPGAARLAAEAALRSGAGLVHAAVAPSSVDAVMAGRPEIMCRGVESPAELAALAERVDVIVVGPGIGRERWGTALVEAMLETDKPLVIDADGLNHLAAHRQQRANWVLTPHPAEAARLLDSTTADVQQDRAAAAAELALRFDAVAVLKGACSLVAQATDVDHVSLAVCDYGNPGMATGGTGDVLAGLIGGLIAQFGLTRTVVEIAVLVHALAGDDAAAAGERGLVASDLLEFIRHRVNPA
ncbi:MAG TPA: NAD(P)H-hydrate dehydratase [Gammaproteobacteria bacterium]